MINLIIFAVAALIAGLNPSMAEDGFPAGRQGHCWACMHGCTAEQDAKLCRWPPASSPRPQGSRGDHR